MACVSAGRGVPTPCSGSSGAQLSGKGHRAEAPMDPRLEVGRGGASVDLACVPSLDISLQAIELGPVGQVAESVLERVVHPPVIEADLRVAVAPDEGVVASGAVAHPLHGGSVLAEEDVSTRHVVGETIDGLRATESADLGSRFEQMQIGYRQAAFAQSACQSEAGDAGAEDRGLQDKGRGEVSADRRRITLRVTAVQHQIGARETPA